MERMEFPRRVTLGEDGVYRWAYDMDMYRNHDLRNVLLKIAGIICLACYALLLFLFDQGHDLDARRAAVLLLPFAGAMLLVLAGYYLAAFFIHGTYHLRFAMNNEAVALVRSDATVRFLASLALAADAAGMAMGKPGEGMRTAAAMRAGSASGLTYFRQVRSLEERPRFHALHLRVLGGANQIWVPEEDYEFVRDFMLERVPKRAIRKKAWPRRLAASALLSLLLNLLCLGINVRAFERTRSLPLAITYPAGNMMEQRAFALRVYHFMEDTGSGREAFHRMSYDVPLGVAGFLAVGLVFFLLLCFAKWIRKKNRGE